LPRVDKKTGFILFHPILRISYPFDKKSSCSN
jgi:hypothetical protein